MNRFNLSALAVRQDAVTLFLILTVACAGIFAYLDLGRAEDPYFTIKALTVTAAWPGATAQQMQDLVAEPLEKRLQELRWYDHVDTFTRPGLAFMTLALNEGMPKAERAEQFYQARKKLTDQAHLLPQGVLGPWVDDEYSDVYFALYALKANGMPLRQLTREAETLRARLLQVPGVQKVDIVGERPEKIFVDFTYARLAALGIGPSDIFDAIRRQNALNPAGSIETKGPQIFVRLDGAYDDLDGLRDTPIQAGARTLKLADVATVERGYEDPPTFEIRHDGDPALVLGVVMREGWNGLTLGKALDAEEKSLAGDLPLGLTFTKISDQARNISDAFDEFILKFFVALVVVMAVGFAALGWRAGIVVAAAVPLTLSAVCVTMLVTGRVFDRITLGALILSLGLLVDDAIIAIEMMVVKMEEGASRSAAAAFAWTVTAAPMLSGTLLTVIGLMPVGFAQSAAGEYAGNLFWVVGFALISSWVVAVVFIPYLGVKLLPDADTQGGGPAAIYNSPRYHRFRRIVRGSVEHKHKIAIAVTGLFALSVLGMGSVTKQFFPSSGRPELIVETYLPEGSSIEATTATVATVEAWLKQQPEAKIITSYIGEGAPRFFLSLNPELPDPAFAKTIILTPDAEARDALKARLRTAIAAGLGAEARIRVTQLLFGPPVRWPVMLRVMGPDPAMLRKIADEVEQVMRANPHTRMVNRDWGNRVPTAHFVIDQSHLRLIGLTPADLADQLQSVLTGTTMTQMREDIRTVDIVARATGPARLDDLFFVSKDGKDVPLSQIGQIETQFEEPILKRRDRTPTMTVEADIDEALQPPEVTAEILAALKPVLATLPDGYRIETGGSVEASGKANKALADVFPLMLGAMLLVIMIQVRSFAAMFMVLLTAPLGLIGAVAALLIFHQPFGFNAILGLIGLAGILMRNTLILLGQIEADRAAGMTASQAVVEATVRRARPVVLTALAAVLAFIPLTFSVFWGPLAYVLIGGTAIGTVLTLVFLPALYAVWFKVGLVPQRAGLETLEGGVGEISA
jgi:multidrug efflux pump subunit AcrB